RKSLRQSEWQRVERHLFGWLKATKKEQLRALPDDGLEKDEAGEGKVVPPQPESKGLRKWRPPVDDDSPTRLPDKGSEIQELDRQRGEQYPGYPTSLQEDEHTSRCPDGRRHQVDQH